MPKIEYEITEAQEFVIKNELADKRGWFTSLDVAYCYDDDFEVSELGIVSDIALYCVPKDGDWHIEYYDRIEGGWYAVKMDDNGVWQDVSDVYF